MALAFAALWVGTPLVAALVTVAALLGAREFGGLVSRLGARPPAWLLYPLTAWLALRFVFPPAYTDAGWALVAALAVGLVIGLASATSMQAWASAIAGAVYAGLSLGFFVGLDRWHAVDSTHFGLRLVSLVLVGPVVYCYLKLVAFA